MRRAALCVPVLLVSSALGIWAQSDSKTSLPATAVTTSGERSQASDQEAASTSTKDSGHNWHLRFEAIHGSVGYFHGPAFYPYSPYEYSPFFSAALWSTFGDPFWQPYPGYAPNFGHADGKGEVKLTDAPKNAKVYLDGAYAGTAEHLKHIWLAPGAYNLAVATTDHGTFEQRIYVLSGKTVKIAANQAPNLPEKEKP
jgi:PEGA domain